MKKYVFVAALALILSVPTISAHATNSAACQQLKAGYQAAYNEAQDLMLQGYAARARAMITNYQNQMARACSQSTAGAPTHQPAHRATK